MLPLVNKKLWRRWANFGPGTTYEIEDAILRRIYMVTLNTDDTESDSRLLYLKTTAAEMLSEGKDLKLRTESMERVLIDRLSVEADEPPFQYLVSCFRRACEEEMTDVVRPETEITAVHHAKDLAVSYCRIFLGNPDVLPNWDSDYENSPLLPLLLSESEAAACPGAITTSPPGFISKLFKEGDYDSLEPIFTQLYEVLRGRALMVSVLGDFQRLFWAFLALIQFPVGAKVLVDQLKGLSDLNGRDIATSNVLGAFLSVSGLPDPYIDGEPFTNPSSAADVRTVMNKLRDDLANALTTLLRNTEFRENVLQYIADLINKNAARDHLRFDPWSCASAGTLFNLSAVMLRLCEALLDGNWTKIDEIDPRYVLSSRRLELRGLTALHATSDQISGWSESGNVDHHKFPLTCECFFMTARALNLGLRKACARHSNLLVSVEITTENLSSWKAKQDESPSPSLRRKIAALEKSIELIKQDLSCYEAQIRQNKVLLKRALYFYRMMVVWMVDLAGGFQIPAPETCPEHFAAMPEHFVEGAMEFLIFVSMIDKAHEALDHAEVSDFLNFIIMFMCSPQFIQNPHLRTKMFAGLNIFLIKGSAKNLLEVHQPAVDHFVRNLLRFYADIDALVDKFELRFHLSNLLKYLWKVPGHRNSWRRIANEEENGVYLQFLNSLTNDGMLLLDEGLNKIMIMAEPEPPLWVHAKANIGLICFTSEEIVAPFLLPEIVGRIATMLNYFLSRLVMMMMFKRNLPEELQLKELLTQIMGIYVNLARGDEESVFVAAISRDQSYSEELFGAAAEELMKKNTGKLEKRLIDEFLELGRKVKVAAQEAAEAESALGEIPEEFMDPIMNTLMTDPVILPNTNARIDRPVILRHLLTKSTDPFNGLPLTADVLIPDAELKAKIDRFLQR